MPDRKQWEGRGVVYDDQADQNDNEVLRDVRAPKTLRDLRGPDQLRCRWAPWNHGQGKGWVEFTDPFSGERHEVPTKYAEGAPWNDPALVPDDVVAEPAPQTFVYRAMDALDRQKRREARERAALEARRRALTDYDPEEPL